MSLLDRSTGKVSLGRLGRRRTQTLFSFLRPWNNGRHLRFEDRRCKGKAKGPALLLLRLRAGMGQMEHGGASTSKKAAHQDRHGGRGSIAGSTRACWRWRSLPESMLDLDGPLSGGQGRADPCDWTLEARRPAAKGSQERMGLLSRFRIPRGAL